MFTPINKIFVTNTNEKHIVFYNDGTPIYMQQYKDDVARYANLFTTIPTQEIVLYIPDDLYLFYVCFMALMQSNKHVILPALLTNENSKPLLDITHYLITNKTDSFKQFNIIDLNQKSDSCWQFIDMDDGIINFFTSGSTGTPKKIRKTFHMLSKEIEFHCENQKYLIEKNPVMISSVGAYHMYGLLWRFLYPLAGGIASDLDIVFTPEELQHKQSVYENVLFATTPSFLDGITRYQNQYEFKNNCNGIYSSGSLLDIKTSQNAYKMFGVSPFEIFGSTETGGVAQRQQINGPQWNVFAPVKANATQDNTICIESEFSYKTPYIMSDIVEFINDNQFLLKGRGDRMVKIAEERVSLPEIEKKICDYQYINKSYVTALTNKDRTFLGAMITLNDDGKEHIIKIGRHKFIMDFKQYLLKFFHNIVLPRKIRIVEDIPVNSQGKYIKSDINSMFESNIPEPIMQQFVKTDSLVSADLTFLHDSSYFSGHFPECPILPGVIQIHFVMHIIRQYFHTDANDYHLLKLKFSSLILPDNKIHFELNKINDNEFGFEYSNGDTKFSTGKIRIGK